MASLQDLIDAFNQRREPAKGKRSLVGSDYFMPKSSKEDLAKRQATLEESGLPGVLKQAGQEMYENPVVNTAIGFTPGAGDLQSAFEALKAAREGQWGEAGLNAVGMLPFVPALKTVWHGSPHSFNAFDLSKIGTGEGAQAYGHGLYFADAPEVAKSYQANREYVGKALAGESPSVNWDAQRIAQDAIDIHGKEAGSHLQGVLKQTQTSKNAKQIEENKKIEEAIGLIQSGNLQPQGNLYKVDLPDEHIAKMLDWDKPLSEQSQSVIDALHNAGIVHFEKNIGPKTTGEIGKLGWTSSVKSMPGETLYRRLTEGKFTPEMFVSGEKKGVAQGAVSNAMYQAGIPGIQYLDQASRGAGEGTRNYVVFSDELPKILERNAQPIK